MPPLRSRREDIPALTNYFLREICRRRRLPPKALSRPALSLIAALPWRGNAIELQIMLESVVAGLSGGKGIGIEDVLAHVRLDAGGVVSRQRRNAAPGTRPFRGRVHRRRRRSPSRPNGGGGEGARDPAD